MAVQRATHHSIESTSLADLLERVLDKGIVIAGDITIKLVDVELLTIQLRLVVCSVDKATEMGIDFWTANPAFSPKASQEIPSGAVARLEQRMAGLEASLARRGGLEEARGGDA